nr:GlsB/YeaQ/YmgE family stress response membrane protein [Pelagibacterium limicola]
MERSMEGIGWIGAIIIGGLAGWIAEKIMKSNHSLILNIVLGIVGAVVANAILMFVFNATLGGWIGQLIVAVIGACLLIGLARAIRGRA